MKQLKRKFQLFTQLKHLKIPLTKAEIRFQNDH